MASSGSVSAEKRQGKVKGFFRGVWTELKKVHWPNKKQVVIYTAVVLVCIFFMALAIYVVDMILEFILSFIIG